MGRWESNIESEKMPKKRISNKETTYTFVGEFEFFILYMVYMSTHQRHQDQVQILTVSYDVFSKIMLKRFFYT